MENTLERTVQISENSYVKHNHSLLKVFNYVYISMLLILPRQQLQESGNFRLKGRELVRRFFVSENKELEIQLFKYAQLI